MNVTLDLSPLENSVAQLDEALDVYHSDLVLLEPRLKRLLRSAVVQAFEFTYALSYGMTVRYLRLASANPAEIDQMSFNDVIREAYRQGLVRSELPAWREHRRKRGTTSHAYDEDLAQEVLEHAPIFQEEARFLLNQLQIRSTSLDQPC